jgi:cryptochrome
LPKLFKLWKITHLVFEKDTDAYARHRDAEVTMSAKEAGVEVIIRMGRTLYDPDELVEKNGNKPTMSMSQVQKAASTLGEPTRPLTAPKSLPDPGELDLSSIDHEIPAPEPDFNAAHRTAGKEDQYKSIMGPKKDFAVPTLAEMGIPAATTPIRGGETLALSKLARLCSDSTLHRHFRETQVRTHRLRATVHDPPFAAPALRLPQRTRVLVADAGRDRGAEGKETAC